MTRLIMIFVLHLLFLYSQVMGNENDKKKEINFGFSIELFNEVDLNDGLVAIQVWANELVKESFDIYSVKTKIFQTNNEIIEAYKNHELDFIALLSADYFEISKQISIKPLITSNHLGTKGIEYIILSRKEDQITSLNQLKAKKLIFAPSNFSAISEYWLKSKLIEIEEPKGFSYFSNTSYAGKQSQAILSVFFKKYDACLVTYFSFETMIELNPQIGTELSIVEKSQPLINAIVCGRENMDNKITEDFLSFVSNLHISSSGKLLTSLFGVIELKPYDEETLQRTKKILEGSGGKNYE